MKGTNPLLEAAAREADVVTREPLNVESSWPALKERVTPLDGFYTRNNFAIPRIDPDSWRLRMRGFGRDADVRFDDLLARRSVEMDVVLECAGNGRTFFEPRPEGTAWRERAVACATFRGAPLVDLLDEAGVPRDAVEIVFEGGDGGAFERSLPVDVARSRDTILAWEMNGEPLRPQHGAPVRLVVPSWFGVASVKWLVAIRPTREPFRGHFQAERYVYATSKQDAHPSPVREKRVNSLIVSPAPGERVKAGAPLIVSGWAWSGHARIHRVEVSADGGKTWIDAELGAPAAQHAWRAWKCVVVPTRGDVALQARAHDEAGHKQPETPEWNVHGYGHNGTRTRAVIAE